MSSISVNNLDNIKHGKNLKSITDHKNLEIQLKFIPKFEDQTYFCLKKRSEDVI